MRARMPSVTGVIATEVAMTVVAVNRTSVPAGPAVPSPAKNSTFGVRTPVGVPRSSVELAVGYGLSAETAAASE